MMNFICYHVFLMWLGVRVKSLVTVTNVSPYLNNCITADIGHYR